MSINVKDLLSRYGKVKAEDIEKAEKIDEAFAGYLQEGFHENCVISDIEVSEDKDGLTTYKNDASWTRVNITFKNDDGQFKKMFAWPSTRLLYGEKGSSIFYVKLKQLINAAHRVDLNKDVALMVFNILQDNGQFLIGCKVNLKLGYNKCSHVVREDVGVYTLAEWLPQKKRYEKHEIVFKDFEEAKAYAEREMIDLGFMDMLSVEPAMDYVIDPVMIDLYTSIGLMGSDEEVQEEMEEESEEEAPIAPPPKKTSSPAPRPSPFSKATAKPEQAATKPSRPVTGKLFNR